LTDEVKARFRLKDFHLSAIHYHLDNILGDIVARSIPVVTCYHVSASHHA